jgi:hypothetical protein
MPLGIEDKMHKDFANIMQKYELYKLLNCSFWSYDASGENRDLKTGSLLKSKGLKAGQSDYKFKIIKDNIANYIYLEFKSEKGKQSPNQKKFEKTCSAKNEFYYLVYSIKDAIKILMKHNIIKNENLSY